MSRRSLITAWDHLWRETDLLHRVGVPTREPTNNEKHLAFILQQLCQMRLPIDAVYLIADALDTTRKICNEKDVTT